VVPQIVGSAALSTVADRLTRTEALARRSDAPWPSLGIEVAHIHSGDFVQVHHYDLLCGPAGSQAGLFAIGWARNAKGTNHDLVHGTTNTRIVLTVVTGSLSRTNDIQGVPSELRISFSQ